ncbi:MAG: hypothetical protein N2Z21_06090 [Candidatus Sumerlaeaceae bacterium]|nr:hypothetical protein [Candidatus Sumerlaeaceae bacterium]
MHYLPTPVEILSVTRAAPGTISLCDQAWCRHKAGLLAYLMEEVSPVLRRGSGVHPATGLPIGMAIHAAIVACDGEQTGIGVCRAVEATLEAPLAPRDDVISHATIIEIGQRHVTCRAEAYAERVPSMQLIAAARVVLVRVQQGKAVPLFA